MDIRAALEELGIDEKNYRMLGLLPLVYVAWADGRMQRAERSAILQAADETGWLGDEGHKLLRTWLDKPPSEAYMKQGIAVLNALACDQGRTNLNADSLQLLLMLCNDVAKAAGGFFGITEAISEREAQVLDKVAQAFDLEHADSWGPLVDDAD